MSNASSLRRNWQQNRELLIQAAYEAGVDPRIMIKIAGFESGFDTHARPVNHRHPANNRVRQFDGTMATSSAYGLGQFTDATWLDVIHRYGGKYGVEHATHLTKTQANAPSLRDDPRLQAAMLAEFTRENAVRGQRLGGADPDANVYALHNLGTGDGPAFLTALRERPEARVDAVLSPPVILGNPALYGDGSRTLAEAYRSMGAKLEAYSEFSASLPGSAVHGAPRPAVPRTTPTPDSPGQPANAAIYNEARQHFLGAGDRFEYGRNDMRLRNREGNGLTDPSRNERDLDGDGLTGVDCSSFVWRGLKNAGFAVPNSPFTSHDLFNGHAITAYSRKNFDVLSAADARAPGGSLQPGDILLFRSRSGEGQHVAIFKGYDAHGRIQFIGSQVQTGPGEVTITPGGTWDGGGQEIVGALRAKPDFRLRAAAADHPEPRKVDEPVIDRIAPTAREKSDHATAHTRVGPTRQGDHGARVLDLQRRLFELGYRGEDAKPLAVDGDFGRNTSSALKQFQREHGLAGKGVAGPRTEAALGAAERALLSSPTHPQHALYEQALRKVHDAELAHGTAIGAHSERIAAALTVECVRKGLTRIDRVEINGDRTLARAVHDRPGNAESGLGNTDMISLPRASTQPLAQSSRECGEVVADAAARIAALQPHRQQPTVSALAH